MNTYTLRFASGPGDLEFLLQIRAEDYVSARFAAQIFEQNFDINCDVVEDE